MSTSSKGMDVSKGDANARSILVKQQMEREMKNQAGKGSMAQAQFNRKKSLERHKFEEEMQARAQKFSQKHMAEFLEEQQQQSIPSVDGSASPPPPAPKPKPKPADSHTWRNATGDGYARYYLEKLAAKKAAEAKSKTIDVRALAAANRRKSMERQGFEDELRNHRLKKLEVAVRKASTPRPATIAESKKEGDDDDDGDSNSALKKQIIAAAMRKLGKQRAMPEPKLGIELGKVLGAADSPMHIRRDIPLPPTDAPPPPPVVDAAPNYSRITRFANATSGTSANRPASPPPAHGYESCMFTFKIVFIFSSINSHVSLPPLSPLPSLHKKTKHTTLTCAAKQHHQSM